MRALLLRIYQALGLPQALGACLVSSADATDWQWVPLALDCATPADAPTLIGLPEGEVYVQIFSRSSGLKIRQLFVANDVKATPTGCTP